MGTHTTTYNYDNQGHLRDVRLPDGTHIEYVIGAKGKRVAKKVNGQITKRWLYVEGLMPAAELDAAGNVLKRYGPGYIVKNDTTYRVIKDHLGSVRMIVNSQTGDVVQRIDYNAYGNIAYILNEDAFTDIGFAGGLYDHDTGLVRFGARDYDPAVGRWIAKDLIGFAGGTSNLYEYGLNDPVNTVDPDGLQAIQYSGSIGFSGGMFAVAHAEMSIGVSVDWNDIWDTKFFVNGQYSGMLGVGVAAYGTAGPTRGITSEQIKSGYTKSNIIHGEAAIGAGEVGSVSGNLALEPRDSCAPSNSLEIDGGSYSYSGRGGLGIAGYIGAGVGQSHTIATPSIREMLILALY